uniref:Uncharacterized protein n=1 Tax=Lepeophtheirus salmonis TaxID=72036 RepID=A0A0K2TAU2_LEPSM
MRNEDIRLVFALELFHVKLREGDSLVDCKCVQMGSSKHVETLSNSLLTPKSSGSCSKMEVITDITLGSIYIIYKKGILNTICVNIKLILKKSQQ